MSTEDHLKAHHPAGLYLLRAATQAIDSGGRPRISELAEATGLGEEEVEHGLQALERRRLVAIQSTMSGPLWVNDVAGEAYLMTGLHPDGNDALEALAGIIAIVLAWFALVPERLHHVFDTVRAEFALTCEELARLTGQAEPLDFFHQAADNALLVAVADMVEINPGHNVFFAGSRHEFLRMIALWNYLL